LGLTNENAYIEKRGGKLMTSPEVGASSCLVIDYFRLGGINQSGYQFLGASKLFCRNNPFSSNLIKLN